MPETCLPKLSSPVTVEAQRDVARRFEVSLPAAAIRLQRAYGGFRAFGVDNERVTWAAGGVSLGDVSLLPDTLREVLATAPSEAAEAGREGDSPGAHRLWRTLGPPASG